jgi:hypothetical protein
MGESDRDTLRVLWGANIPSISYSWCRPPSTALAVIWSAGGGAAR